MAITNHERVGKALDLLKEGLQPFVERELKSKHAQRWFDAVKESVGPTQESLFADESAPPWDAASLLTVMWNQWQLVFRKTLGHSERSMVSELREVRNNWAHQRQLSSDDTDRALDSAERLLTAIAAPQAEEVRKIKMELRRTVFDEQARTEKRKRAGATIESAASDKLKPWREVVNPHKDVASGRYQQAEFAADLWQVHLGEGSDEYKEPIEFFRRTYLTDSLKAMLVSAVRRLSGKGGDPVVQLQTNFGGGKTHSMLALYHLFSGANPTDLSGIDTVMSDAGVKSIPTANVAVLVGTKISPSTPSIKSDGSEVRTLWGELAWQLGGKKAFAKIKADDENATSPGDALREMFNEYGPCVILIDEWVAYARMLHDQSDLPAGGFETQFTFAQALTEAAKLADNCLLVISLPASDTTGSPHTRADDAEVGGIRGREALDRLKNVVGRLESSWRPASAEEGFEIVRRRLFEPMTEAEQFRDRDITARGFADLYRTQHQEFPPECRDSDYEKRIKAAYPIHPEIFDRLYTDWSTLAKFQRTRGVLRLMASVIHCLWEKGDKDPLILPAHIPIDDRRVQSELTRYLSDNWVPVIEKDVDGPSSLPLNTDSDVPNLGKFSACRRVARTIYMGSAPLSKAAHRGLEDRSIKLGCVMPGESPAIFGDALRRLAGVSTYLYQDGPRYWYSTQPTVTKLADDLAEQLKHEPDKVVQELEKRLRDNFKNKGDFSRIHPFPASGNDVPDDLDARLVVLGVDCTFSKEAGNLAELAAQSILESRGNSPRLYRNTLVFLAADKSRLQDLDEATRKYIAWQSILSDKETMNLDPQQVKQAENQKSAANNAVTSRIPETYQWLLVPIQDTPQKTMQWQASKLSGSEFLAERASRKLKNDGLLLTMYAPTSLKLEIDRIPLWRGNHVPIKQLVEDFARYSYLSRLKNSDVLLGAIADGLALLTWQQDSFAYADDYDDESKRYRGLRCGQVVSVMDAQSPALLVKPAVAAGQLETETKPGKEASTTSESADAGEGGSTAHVTDGEPETTDETDELMRRFYGSVSLSSLRVGRDAGRIAEEIIQHLSGLPRSNVKIKLEIEANVPDGVPETIIRTVSENCRTLGFDQHGFEEE